MALVPKVPIIVAYTIGVIVFVVGVAISPIFDSILHSTLKSMIPLTNSSSTLSTWEDPSTSADMYLSFYFFDVANPGEVTNGGKPYLVEKGPYVYTERKVKHDVEFHDNNTVTYKERRTMIFNSTMSSGSENDTFVTINIPLMTVVIMLDKIPIGEEALNLILKVLLKQETLFKRISVYELIWGYQDTLLKDIYDLVQTFHIKGLPIPADGYFGFFYQKNSTDDGEYNVMSGQGDLNAFMEIKGFNGKRNLAYWKTDYCNMLNGTDGSMYHPFLAKDEQLYVFSSDICRSLVLTYNNTVKFSDKDISLYRFTPPPISFSYPPVNPDNACYCVGDSCPHDGVMNISACQQGAPVFVSQPHFLNGPYYEKQVAGLMPNDTKHNTYIDIDPTIGIVLQGSKRLQMNLEVKSNKNMPLTSKFPSLLLPLIWLEESAMINANGLQQLDDELVNPQQMVMFFEYFLMFAGILTVILTTVYLINWRLKLRKLKSKSYEERTAVNSGAAPNGYGAVDEDKDWANMIRDGAN